MALVPMELTPAERKEEARENAPEAYVPRYAGCLSLHFDEEVLKRLKLDKPLPVGTVVRIEAEARVTGEGKDVHEFDGKTHVDLRNSIQITAMDLTPAETKKSLAQQLYSDGE